MQDPALQLMPVETDTIPARTTSLAEVIAALQAFTDDDEVVVHAVTNLCQRGVLRQPH